MNNFLDESRIKFEEIKNSDLELNEKLSNVATLGRQLNACSNGSEDICSLAIECFEYAAKYDHLDSLCSLGIMYLECEEDYLSKAKDCFDNLVKLQNKENIHVQNFSFFRTKLNTLLDNLFYNELKSKDAPTEEEIDELARRASKYTSYDFSIHRNKEEVLEMLEYCLSLGNIQAAIRLAYLYRFGNFSNNDLEKAVEYAEIGAKHNDKECLYWLGLQHFEGSNGVKKDLEKSFKLIEKSALQDHSAALCQLGYCSEYGYGCEINLDKAFEYAKKSAELGHSMGQSNLAECYELGVGTEVNIDLAIEWYTKSSDKGNDIATKRLRNLKKKLNGPKKSTTPKKKEIYKVMNVDLLKQKFDIVYNSYSNGNHDINKIELMKVDTKQIEGEYGKMPTSLKDLLTNFGAIYIDGRLDNSIDLNTHRIDCRFDDSALSVCKEHQTDLFYDSEEEIDELLKEDIDSMVEEDECYGRYIALLKYGYPLTTYYEDCPIFLDVHTNAENPPVYYMDTEGSCSKLSNNLEEYMNELIENGCFICHPSEKKLTKEELKSLNIDFSNIKESSNEVEEQNDNSRIALEYVDEGSNKFWAVTWNSKTFTVTYGKKGSKGVSKTTISETTEKDANKQANAKMKKGYVIDENFDWNSII